MTLIEQQLNIFLYHLIYILIIQDYVLIYLLGNHLWGTDLRSDDNPIEAALETVCRKNDEYLGKASVDWCRKNGVKKRLVHLHINE